MRAIGTNYKSGGVTIPSMAKGSLASVWPAAGVADPSAVAFAASVDSSGTLNDGTDDITITGVVGIHSNITVALVDGGTAGSETISFSGTTLTVSMEDGVSTQTQITAALVKDPRIATAVGDTPASAWTLGGGNDTVLLASGTGYGDGSAFVIYGKDPGDWNDNLRITIDIEHPTLTLAAAAINGTTDEINCGSEQFTTGEAVVLKSLDAADVTATGLANNTTYYVINNADSTGAGYISLATTAVNAVAGTAINIAANNDYSFTLEPLNKVTETGAFIIKVYQSTDLATSLETFTCKRGSDQTSAKDGFGNNIYIETALEASNYIRAIDNVLVDDSIDITAVPIAQPLVGGDDGNAITDSSMTTAANVFTNEEDRAIQVFMDGGYATAAYHNKMITIADGRNDMEAIGVTPLSTETSSDYVNDIVDYRAVTLNANTSKFALYTGHVKIFDEINNRELFIAPDGFIAGSIAETSRNFRIWFPVAGPIRGLLQVLDVRRRFSTGEMDTFADNGINPIRFARGRGIFIQDQLTQLSRPTTLRFLNVRLMLNFIQPALKNTLEDYLNELNDVETRLRAKNVTESFMLGIQSERGVKSFTVVCDTTNNSENDELNGILNIDLRIVPIVGVREINFTTILDRDNGTVTTALAA
jgi:hypothetical protein